MSQLLRIKNIQDTVKAILIDSKESRDNDRLLILKVWGIQAPALRNDDFSFIRFSRLYLSGQLADSESITRARRLIQADHPHLKGRAVVGRDMNEHEVRTGINKVQT